MNYKLSLFTLILVAMIHTGCEDFFDTTIPLDPPVHVPKIACTAKATKGDSILQIRLSNSIGILDKDTDVKAITGAKVILKLNGQLYQVTELQTPTQDTYYEVDFGRKLTNGDKIEFTAEKAGFETIKTSSYVPTDPKIRNVVYDKDGGVDEFGDPVSKVSFDIEIDNEDLYFSVNSRGYYRYCSQYINNDCVEYDSSYTQTAFTFRDINTVQDYYVFQKSSENKIRSYVGTSSGYRFGFPSVENANIIFQIYPKPSFDYIVSLEQYFIGLDNPFSTPVNVRSNIENGYGHFELTNEVIIPQ
jgi:hypothetical protein